MWFEAEFGAAAVRYASVHIDVWGGWDPRTRTDGGAGAVRGPPAERYKRPSRLSLTPENFQTVLTPDRRMAAELPFQDACSLRAMLEICG